MPVEFLGMGAHNDDIDTHARTTEAYDPAYLVKLAQAHENNDWDHVLFAYGSGSPDPIVSATYVAAHTDRIQLRVAHRPNAALPTTVARQFLTLDHLSRGRVTVHYITGGSQAEQAREGDYLEKDERYARTKEYIELVRRIWDDPEPFSHSSKYYSFDGFSSEIRPYAGKRPGISFGGSSPAAWQAGASTADIYAIFGEPLAESREQQRNVLTAAREQGRETPLRWQVAFRPIIAPTDDLAWERAHGILGKLEARATAGQLPGASHRQNNGAKAPENAGSQRLLSAADRGDILDRALWTVPAKSGWAAGSSTALVGSYETVALALLDYVDLGFEIFGIRGYEDFLDDATEFGQNVIPLVRQEVARREAAGWVSGPSLAALALA